jgi:hypothetical protein
MNSHYARITHIPKENIECDDMALYRPAADSRMSSSGQSCWMEGSFSNVREYSDSLLKIVSADGQHVFLPDMIA